MIQLLPDEDGSLSAEAVEPMLKAIKRADAVVLGPGLGRGPHATGLRARGVRAHRRPARDRRRRAQRARRPSSRRTCPQRRWPTVLTPHAGELASCSASESDDVAQHRLRVARAAAAQARAIVVLKGDDTLVASPDGRVAVSTRRGAGARHGRHRATCSPA